MNYFDKLNRLQSRRQGITDSGRTALKAYASESYAADSAPILERFADIAEPESVKYALGSMQPVDYSYTKNSYDEAERVRARLAEGLAAERIRVAFEYQGSVPLDVHIKGNSDIDLLVLHDQFVTVEPALNDSPSYNSYQGGSPVAELSRLRQESIAILNRRYPEANVDTSGSKSISISGGSLRRTVDVVPAHWHDTLVWRESREKSDRHLYIFDSHKNVRLINQPFKHIKMVKDKCDANSGGLRKVIRLLKNLRSDATKDINISSYDITSIAYHMSPTELSVPFGVDLLLVERARNHLKFIIDNQYYRDLLYVPNGSRKIYDSPEKLQQTISLHAEVSQLAEDIYKELMATVTSRGRTRDQLLARTITF